MQIEKLGMMAKSLYFCTDKTIKMSNPIKT
jgi:hypothetical protein